MKGMKCGGKTKKMAKGGMVACDKGGMKTKGVSNKMLKEMGRNKAKKANQK